MGIANWNDRGTLMHYGVKGMHWGIRRGSTDTGPSSDVHVSRRKSGLVKTQGGKNHPPHEDAIKAAIARQKAKTSSTDALSTKELQDLVTRMNLEQQYSRLKTTDVHNKSEVQNFIKNALAAGKTANEIHSFLNSPAGKIARAAVKSKLKK